MKSAARKAVKEEDLRPPTDSVIKQELPKRQPTLCVVKQEHPKVASAVASATSAPAVAEHNLPPAAVITPPWREQAAKAPPPLRQTAKAAPLLPTSEYQPVMVQDAQGNTVKERFFSNGKPFYLINTFSFLSATCGQEATRPQHYVFIFLVGLLVFSFHM